MNGYTYLHEISTKYQRQLYFLGKLIGLLGLVYVFYILSIEFTLSQYVENILAFKKTLIVLILINICSYILGVSVWHSICNIYSQTHIPYKKSLYYYTKTDIAKYLPGNFLHLVGRQIYANKLNLNQKSMMKVTIYFTYLIVISSLTTLVFLSILPSIVPVFIKITLFVFTFIIIWLSYKLYPIVKVSEKIQMVFILVTTHLLQSLILIYIFYKQIPSLSIEYLILIAAIYIFSWIVGFITPGASGGIGVREGVFILIASYFDINISTQVVVFSVLMIRLINILTDIIAFSLTFLQKKISI